MRNKRIKWEPIYIERTWRKTSFHLECKLAIQGSWPAERSFDIVQWIREIFADYYTTGGEYGLMLLYESSCSQSKHTPIHAISMVNLRKWKFGFQRRKFSVIAPKTYICVPTEKELTSVIMIHGGNLTIKN